MDDKIEKQEQQLIEKLANSLLFKAPTVTARHTRGEAGIELLSNGAFFYLRGGTRIHLAHSKALAADGRPINTRTAKYRGTEEAEASDPFGPCLALISRFEENGLILLRKIRLYETGELCVQVELSEKKRSKVRTRYLAPVDAPYPDKTGKSLFLSLDQKMLLVPYDNDMWARYESAVPRPGRTSYDITAIYDEHTFEGLVLGAVDHDVWKNAISWAAHDARAFTAYSGAADAATHDVMPHGVVSGESVSSARFFLYWTENIKTGMEHFGEICTRFVPPRPWSGGPIFGWNSYSALGMGLKLSHWKEAGNFLRSEIPDFCDDSGVRYINLDGCFGMSRREIRRIVEDLHQKGQKAGWYSAPCIAMSFMAKLPPFRSMLLTDDRDEPLPPADGSYPLDVTHPQWENYARSSIRSVLDLGFDYIKLDFLSHAGVEGCHHRREFTGRMALNHAYQIIADEIGKAGREIFVSLSIAPLFPYHLGNGRRSCCDSFGHIEDVRYVLNALNFGWWTNGTLYHYNDPDHLALYHCVIDGRGITSEAEARSRYLSGVISGTMMILSDNYGPDGDSAMIAAARQRTKVLASNPELNALARLGKAFVPVDLSSDTTPFYTLTHEGRHYAALFNFHAESRPLGFPALRGGLPENGTARSLLDGSEFPYEGNLSFSLDGHDAVILEITAR